MFEGRLKFLLFAAGLATLVIVGRLFEMQVVHAGYYRARAERTLVLRPQALPFIRGSILDRTGEPLVSDEACWDITIDYEVLKAQSDEDVAGMSRQLRRWYRSGRWDPPGSLTTEVSDEQLVEAFRDDLGRMWVDVASVPDDGFSVTVEDLHERARGICERIGRVRRVVWKRRGFESPVAEERVPHAVVSGLTGGEQIAGRERLARYPWVHIEPSSVRAFTYDAEAFAHVLGRVGRVDAETIAGDPNADDPFAKYKGNETHGITGVEFAAESWLRGRRGQVTLDRQQRVIEEDLVDPENGQDVRLTIHGELQRRLFRLLGDTVRSVPESSGGSIVVVDVDTREVLSLISYPSYDPGLFSELYPSLRDDTERMPLRFRTVSNGYAPGSTIKPLVCLAGLMNGQITLETRETCTGYLFDGVRDRWRCWRVYGTNTRKAHGTINVVEALKGSCNVFMYRLGEKLGVDRLCSAFDMVHIGQTTGLGLPEEFPGVNPTPGWLMYHKGTSATPGTGRLFAMGQGEILMTPVQVANLMATYADGTWRSLRLLRDAEPGPVWRLPADPQHWLAIRRGMYGVVNDSDGTAHKTAHFQHDRYVICGKTGSATAGRRPTSYEVIYVDEAGEESIEQVPGGSWKDAKDRFVAAHPKATFDPGDIRVATHWPPVPSPDGGNYSHAWFGGFLQPIDSDRRPDWSAGSRIAFAILVEYGGSGGRTSGPLAKAVAAELLDALGPELDPDYRRTQGPGS